MAQVRAAGFFCQKQHTGGKKKWTIYGRCWISSQWTVVMIHCSSSVALLSWAINHPSFSILCPVLDRSVSWFLKHHIIMLCRLALQGWNSELWLKIIHSGFGSLCAFFFSAAECIYLTAKRARRSTETLWPSHWFWLPLCLWTLRLWAALQWSWLFESQIVSRSPCLQFKNGPKTYFQFCTPKSAAGLFLLRSY